MTKAGAKKKSTALWSESGRTGPAPDSLPPAGRTAWILVKVLQLGKSGTVKPNTIQYWVLIWEYISMTKHCVESCSIYVWSALSNNLLSSVCFFSREGKYIPLPQRAREMGLSASSMRGGSTGRTTASTSSRHPPPSCSSPKPSCDGSSPLSARTSFSAHQTQGSPPAASSPPCTNHVLPQSLSHPQALSDTVNGGMEADVKKAMPHILCITFSVCTFLLTYSSRRTVFSSVASRTSPKSQRLLSSRNLRSLNSQSSPAGKLCIRWPIVIVGVEQMQSHIYLLRFTE